MHGRVRNNLSRARGLHPFESTMLAERAAHARVEDGLLAGDAALDHETAFVAAVPERAIQLVDARLRFQHGDFLIRLVPELPRSSKGRARTPPCRSPTQVRGCISPAAFPRGPEAALRLHRRRSFRRPLRLVPPRAVRHPY